MKKIKKCMINIFLFLWYRVAGFLFRLLPIQNNKIVFESFFGKGYGDSPKYIAEELLKATSLKLKIIWLVKGEIENDFPPGIQMIKRGSLWELYHLSTAKVWVDNSRKHFGIKKRKKQYYMQVWHGSINFKFIEKDMNPDIWYRVSAKHDSKMADVMVSASKWQTEQYKRCFWYDGPILEIGMPRNDFWAVSLSTDIKKEICRLFSISEEKNIVLYAPTFRGNDSISAYDMDYENLIRSLEKYWGGSWIILIRLHPNIEKESSYIEYNEKIINASHYSDMNQLILISDLLITDYSSCLFDAVYIEKPSIIYASDVDKYERERGFALPLIDAPALVAQNNEELENMIREFHLSQYIHRCREFSKKYGIIHCGDASKKAAEWIMHVILKNADQEGRKVFDD